MPLLVPARSRRQRARNRRAARRRLGLATYPRMMPRTLAAKRMNQVGTKVFWFKRNGIISPDLAGSRYSFWRTQEINVPATTPVGWPAVKTLYDQYKVLAIKLRLFPANVGIESDSAIFASNALLRGDTVVWSDQRYQPNAPTNVSEVINNASARMINSRRPYTRSLFRPRGNPEWGDTQSATNDSWDGALEMLFNNASPAPAAGAPPTLWYWTIQYKILVRGRRQV